MKKSMEYEKQLKKLHISPGLSPKKNSASLKQSKIDKENLKIARKKHGKIKTKVVFRGKSK
jgi:hypothetical protein